MRRSHLAALGVLVLAAAVAVVVVIRSTPACAAALLLATERTGQATYYGPAAPGGACGFPTPPADHLTAAAGPADYAGAAACGGYLQVTGRLGTVRVKVDNLCPECGPGHLDLSNEAFAALDDPAKGLVPITFHPVIDPALTGGLSVRVKEGSSQWWLALLIDNHGNPLRSVEVSAPGGRWLPLKHTDYNYWLAEQGAGPGPFQVRVTDERGHRAVAAGITDTPGAVQRTSTRLYGPGTGTAAGATPQASTRATTTAVTATPSRAAATSAVHRRAAARTPPGTTSGDTQSTDPIAASTDGTAAGGAPPVVAPFAPSLPPC